LNNKLKLIGVTSISADLDKFGLCPKGVGLLLYRNKEFRKHQYFFYPHWMGGTYPSPTMAGSRTPVMVVASYAVLIFYGKIKYIDQAKRINNAIRDIKLALKNVCEEHNLQIIGDPQVKCFYQRVL
jgi:sphinganine-1-phosphate aldolase